jgi:pimeloyl-ACP methyl ester carboxylesterase
VVFQVFSRRDSCSHEVIRVIRRKTNRRNMIDDHHGRTTGRATLQVRAVDGILGTHTATCSAAGQAVVGSIHPEWPRASARAAGIWLERPAQALQLSPPAAAAAPPGAGHRANPISGRHTCFLRAPGQGSRLVGMDMPETRYARSGDVMIAYQVLGEGPFDVVIVPGAVSHVELQWEAAGSAALRRGLAEHARVIVFDKRGSGLSDQLAGAPTLEERSDDIRAVMDAVGSERAALFGVSEGVPISVVFAASYPERVSALVLYAGMARMLWAPDYLFGATEREMRKETEENFEAFLTPGGLEALARIGFPSADEEEVRAWARVFRYGSSPSSGEALDRMNMAIDVRDVLPVVSAPTLVVHQRADPWVRVEHGRYLAQHIPGAAYAELDGDEHLPTAAGVPEWLARVMPFLQETVTREAPEPDKVLATVLFSDIVGSTAGRPNSVTCDGESC